MEKAAFVVRVALVVLVALALVVRAPRAAADERRPSPQGRALDLFEQSAKAYREGRFQDAVDLLLEARRVKPEPVLLYNLGRAYEALGRSTDAADAYEGYLREDPRAADRRAIEGRAATLRAQAAELERARAAPPAPPVAVPREDASAPARPSSEASVVPWVLAASGLAVLGGGVVLGVVADSRHDAAVADPTQAGAADKQDDARAFATASTVACVAGGVVTAVGLGWLSVRALSSSSRGTAVTLRPGLANVTLQATF